MEKVIVDFYVWAKVEYMARDGVNALGDLVVHYKVVMIVEIEQ